MSLTSKESLFFEAYTHSIVKPFNVEFESSKSFSIDLNYKLTEGKDSFLAEAYPSVIYPLKVSDPILVNSFFKINDLTSKGKTFLYSDPKQSYQSFSFPKEFIWDISIDSPNQYIGFNPFFQEYGISSPNKTQRFRGIFPGIYKVKVSKTNSPTIRSSANTSIRHDIKLQPSIEDSQEYLLGEGYYPLPLSQFYENYHFIDPITVGYSLYYLIAKNERKKIIGLLNNLCDYYLEEVKAKRSNHSYIAGDKALPGFPRTLYRWEKGVKDSIYLEDNLFLGIAILEVLSFLCDRPLSNKETLTGVFNLDNKIFFLLDQITLLATLATDQGNNLCSTYVSKEGYLIEEESIANTYLASLFLTLSLQINYKLETHTIAAKLYRKLSLYPNRPISSNLNLDNEDIDRALIYQAMWVLYFSVNNADSESLVQDIIGDLRDRNIESEELALFFIGWLSGVYPEFEYRSGESLIESPFIDLPLWDSEEELYLSTISPKLVDQCCIGLIELDYQFFRRIDPFPLKAEESYLLINKSYREAIRVLPKGENWFSLEALSNPNSVMASIIKSYTDNFLPFLLNHFLIKDSQSIGKAVAFPLRQFSVIYYPRKKPIFNSDTYWNKLLEDYINLDNRDLTKIESFLSKWIGKHSKINYAQPFQYQFQNISNEILFKDFYPNQSKSLEEVIEKGGIEELVSVDKSLRLIDFDDLRADDDDLLGQRIDEVIWEGQGHLGNPNLLIPSSNILGYLEMEVSEFISVDIINSLVPSGIYFRKAYRENSHNCLFNRELNYGIFWEVY